MEYKLTFEKFQEGLKKGAFLGIRCDDCGSYNFPPQGMCSNCHSSKVEIAEMAGKGVLRTFTVIRVAPEGMDPPYVLAMVELEEGPWALGQVIGLETEKADMGLLGREVKMGSKPFKVSEDTSETPYVITFTLT